MSKIAGLSNYLNIKVIIASILFQFATTFIGLYWNAHWTIDEYHFKFY
jgi:hypothetical protein